MAVFNVSSSSELYAALSNASGGDEIRLASGDYGDFNLGSKSGFDITFNSPITITSASGNNPASFSGMDLNGSENLTFDNVVFDYDFSNGDSESYRPFMIENSSNVTIRNSEFLGDEARSGSSDDIGYGFGIGLFVKEASGITLDSNEFSTWKKGAQFFETDDITVLNNELYDIRSDGMNFGEVQNVLIEGNYFHDFRASPESGDHQDMIQFWKANANGPSTDIIIRGNVFDVGDGSWTQTVFMGDSGRDDRGLYYQDVVIEDNTIYGGHHHGITVGLSDGLEINGNLVIPVKLNPDDPYNAGVSGGVTIPKINVNEGSVNVMIDGNQSVAVNGYEGQSSWSLTNHTYLQDDNPNAPGYIPDLLGDRGDVPDPVPDPGPNPEPSPTPEPAPSPTPEPAPEPAPNQADHGSINLDNQINDYVLDLAAGGAEMGGDARIVETTNGLAVEMSGEQSYVDLGRLQQFEQLSQLAFSVDFHRDVADGSDARLVWNHQKIALGLEDDGLYLKVAVEGSDRWKNIRVDDLGLNDTEAHNIAVMIDEDADHLQIVLDGEVVLDRTDMDFAFSGSGGHEWGWTLGTKWGRWLDGEISDFRIEAGAPFVGESAAPSLPDLEEPPVISSPAPEEPPVVPLEPEEPPIVSSDSGQPPVISPDPEQPPVILPDPGQPSAEVSEINDYVANFVTLQQSGSVEGDIRVVETDDGIALDMGGEKGFADLGRLEEFEQSGEVMFSVDFHRDVADGSDARLVWNHQKIALGLEDDGLYVKVGVAGEGRWETIRVDDLGLNDTDLHNATIILDENEDRLQVIVDDRVVLDETNIDFDFSGDGGYEWGWSLGTKWGRWLDGEISDFRIEGDAQFVDDAPVFDEMIIS